jgi:Protein of unknown function (DUF2809)
VRFNIKYFTAFCVLFFIECLIAMYVHDAIIRPYIGDVLVVILIYCFVKSFYNFNNIAIALIVLIFSYLVEILQYCNLVEHLGLQHNKLANIVIGNSFSWIDMLCYTIGIITTIAFEVKIKQP